jgi:hypothetical protein
MKTLLLLVAAAILSVLPVKAAPDLTGYTLVFREEFDEHTPPLILSPGYGWGPIDSTAPGVKWIEHTPYSGDFGSAYFTGPAETNGDGNGIMPPNPFGFYSGHMNLRAYWDTTISHWRSGIISSVDTHGNGFSKALAYWEARLWLPSGAGVWPSFWLGDQTGLLTKPRTTDAAEIDIMEMYGVDMTQLHQRTHVWDPSGKDIGPVGAGNTTTISGATTGWHTYGCLVNPDLTHFYFDGVETFSYPTQPSWTHPLYAMVDLALGGGWPINLPNGAMLQVEYIRCYARP